jgi:hypothetical protein
VIQAKVHIEICVRMTSNGHLNYLKETMNSETLLVLPVQGLLGKGYHVKLNKLFKMGIAFYWITQKFHFTIFVSGKYFSIYVTLVGDEQYFHYTVCVILVLVILRFYCIIII